MAEVYLLSETDNLLDVLYTATRTCYNVGLPHDMWDERENIDDEKKVKLLNHVICSGHESVLEHVYFTFSLEGLSRQASHQLVRHRIGVAYSQQSQRYCEFKEDEQYLRQLQLSTRDNKQEAYKELEEILNKYFVGVNKDTVLPYSDSLIAYLSALNNGWKAEDARQFLPNAFKTNIVMTVNLRELIHLCNERLCACSQLEIRTMVGKMAKLVSKEYPFLKEYLQPKCERLGYCPESKQRTCGRKPTREEVFKKS